MIAYFNSFALDMTLAQARGASHPGQCDSAVAALLLVPAIKRQLQRIPDAVLREELRSYGAWDDDELQDRDANEARIVWLAACIIRS